VDGAFRAQLAVMTCGAASHASSSGPANFTDVTLSVTLCAARIAKMRQPNSLSHYGPSWGRAPPAMQQAQPHFGNHINKKMFIKLFVLAVVPSRPS
jgi:hypothetical protein